MHESVTVTAVTVVVVTIVAVTLLMLIRVVRSGGVHKPYQYYSRERQGQVAAVAVVLRILGRGASVVVPPVVLVPGGSRQGRQPS